MLSRLSPRLPFLAIACTAVLALSACGGSSDDASTQPAPVETSSSAMSAEPTPSASSSATSASSASPTPQVTKTPEQPQVTETTVAATEEPPRGTVTTVTEEASPAPETTPAQPSPGTDSSDASAAQTATCDYGQIHIAAAVAPGGGAAGSRYMNLTFTNSGSSPCSLSGYPSVNYVDAQGNQIGASARQAAEWTSSGAVLEAGESANATLRETRAGLYDASTCRSTQAAGYRVSIPGTSSSLILSYPAEACASTENSQLSVGQIGAGPN